MCKLQTTKTIDFFIGNQMKQHNKVRVYISILLRCYNIGSIQIYHNNINYLPILMQLCFDIKYDCIWLLMHRILPYLHE